METTLGELSILNVGAGDLKLSFDPANPAEVEKAKQVIQDMLKRGYLVLVEHQGKTRKVKKFDPKTCEYLIAEAPHEEKEARVTKKAPTRIKASEARATAIAPTGGG